MEIKPPSMVTERNSIRLCHTCGSAPDLKMVVQTLRVPFPKTWGPKTTYFRVVFFTTSRFKCEFLRKETLTFSQNVKRLRSQYEFRLILCNCRILFSSHGSHRTELDQTLPQVRQWPTFENGREKFGVPCPKTVGAKLPISGNFTLTYKREYLLNEKRCRQTVTRSFAIPKRTARRSCLVDLLHCQHCILRHMG